MSINGVCVQEKYQRNEKSMSMFLCDPSVEGVYETQVPLLFRAITELGCVSQLSREAQAQSGISQQKQYKLQDLTFIHVNTHPYLDPQAGSNFKQIFLYTVTDKSRNSGLGVVALFIVDSPFTSSSGVLSARAFVWLSNGNSSLLDNKPPLQRLYRRFQPDESIGSVKFVTTYVSSMIDGFKSCNDRLTTYNREKRGPTIVIAQGSSDSRQWRRQLPSLQDYPIAIIPGNSLDELFPAIGWQMFISERLVQRYLYFPNWFADRLRSSRSCHIPVCNLGADSITTMADVTFARVLHQGRHLSWASECSGPDIGGVDSDTTE